MGALPILVAIFVLSGAAGLMYESIWSRYLGLFVGHSAYAQILVLVIFLGGMSLGAHLVGRRSERVREPLVWYAVVELAVAAIGVAFHPLFVAVTEGAYDRLFPALPAGVVATAAKWTIAALLILPQSVLLGATFPLMSAGAIRRTPGQPGRTLALLYFANSLGAAAGVLVAGFVLLAAVGLPGTGGPGCGGGGGGGWRARVRTGVRPRRAVRLRRRARRARPCTSPPAGQG